MNRIINRCSSINLQGLANISKCCYASSSKSIVSELEVEETPVFDAESKYSLEELEEIRNKSRLEPHHRNILFDQKPYDQSHERYHDMRWYRKRMLGRYGMEAAGVPAGICWPSKEQIEEIKEYESLAYPISIQQQWKEIEERKKEEALAIRKREEDIDKAVANFDKWKAALQAKVDKKEAELREAKEKKERIMQEIREEFGYHIDPRDEKFKMMMEQKEKEDKKRKKEERKKKKDEKLLAYLAKAEEDMRAKKTSGKSEDSQSEENNVQNQKNDKEN